MAKKAEELLESLLRDVDRGYGLGSMTCSVYDSAWISCVSKTTDGRCQWLFPSSFSYVLSVQGSDGGWQWPPPPCDGSPDDTILSTLAALFAITQHIKKPYQLFHSPQRLSKQLETGVAFLSRVLLERNDVDPVNVGFELLVPSLLDLLKDEGIDFEFPFKERISCLRNEKLSKIQFQKLQNTPSATLHSLEAFIKSPSAIFDKMHHCLVNGSMMGSPSATAAYLMRRETWDDSAEAYLRLVISNGDGYGSGAVPSAFPSTNFELAWVTSTFLEAGVLEDSLENDGLGRSAEILKHQTNQKKGLLGFAPGIEPDVDDSAKASVTLSLLGRPGLTSTILKEFGTKGHFKTYGSEKDASVSANCNVLMAMLLDTVVNPGSIDAIETTARFLCDKWFQTSGLLKDKWNVSGYYSTMLMNQAFARLIKCWKDGMLKNLDQQLLRNNILMTMFQSLVRILITQNGDGSWGERGPHEETAYALLTLSRVSWLPYAAFFNQQITSSIGRGRAYLNANAATEEPEYIWVEKVLYGSGNLSRAYIISALHTDVPNPVQDPCIKELCELNAAEMAHLANLLEKLPLFACHPRWLILASWIEGQFFLPRLDVVRAGAVFPRVGVTKAKYVQWIPVIWTAANNINGCKVSNQFLADMMQISVLNFQADEFMEAFVEARCRDNMGKVKEIIERLFPEPPEDRPVPASEQTPGEGAAAEDVPAKTDEIFTSIAHTLNLFATFVDSLTHKNGAAMHDKSQVRRQLKSFLLAHVAQIEDNRHFASTMMAAGDGSQNSRGVTASPAIYQSSRRGFRDWLHAVAAQHTSCPYSLALAMCLAGERPTRASSPPAPRPLQQQYVAADLCRHLAAMCRLYNDYGSMRRDVDEQNLNSVNFPEFRDGEQRARERPPAPPGTSPNLEELGARLMDIASWERRCLRLAMEEMERISEPPLIRMLRVFVDVTDMFGQIYVVKDLASKRLPAAG